MIVFFFLFLIIYTSQSTSTSYYFQQNYPQNYEIPQKIGEIHRFDIDQFESQKNFYIPYDCFITIYYIEKHTGQTNYLNANIYDNNWNLVHEIEGNGWNDKYYNCFLEKGYYTFKLLSNTFGTWNIVICYK